MNVYATCVPNNQTNDETVCRGRLARRDRVIARYWKRDRFVDPISVFRVNGCRCLQITGGLAFMYCQSLLASDERQPTCTFSLLQYESYTSSPCVCRPGLHESNDTFLPGSGMQALLRHLLSLASVGYQQTLRCI